MSDSESISSSDDGQDEVDLDEAEVKLTQMRRAARAKAEGMGKSKLMDRFKGLQTYEEMMREHALVRMQDGLRALLSLHTAAELSSICGVLGLSVKEKGSTSLRLIIDYASEGGKIPIEKIEKLMGVMWEGALFEYLRTIGHPVHTMFCDPKETVLKLWNDGGMLEGSHTFVPHFIAREVKKRNEWVKSADIQTRLDKLRDMQEKAKEAERLVLSDHDYTHILSYFHKTGDLRSYENATREYLIGELEIARSRIDSNNETATMMRDDLADCEQQFIAVAEALNTQLAYSEQVSERQAERICAVEGELQRLLLIVESYVEAEKDRETVGGGSAQALQLRHPELCSHTVRKINEKLMEYRNMRDEADEALRERARHHIDEIDRLEAVVRDLEAKLDFQMRRANFEEERAIEAEIDVRFCAQKMMKMKIAAQIGADESWASALRWAAKAVDVEERYRRVRPMVLAGMSDSNKVIATLCKVLITTLNLASEQQLRENDELIAMRKADDFSQRFRKFLKEKGKAKTQTTGGKGPKKTIVSSSKGAKGDGGDNASKASAASEKEKGKKKKKDKDSGDESSKASSKAGGGKKDKDKKGDKKGDKKAGSVDGGSSTASSAKGKPTPKKKK